MPRTPFIRRPRRSLGLALALGSVLLAALAPSVAQAGDPGDLAADRLLAGLDSPVAIANAGDGTGRLFIVEQRGTVRVVQNGKLLAGYFMDIRGSVTNGGERGLLGLAFHPDFETNRRLFVYYTRDGGDIVISRFTTNLARTDVDEGTAAPLQVIEHSQYSNHNGGALAFGPDGYLYIGVGDGGSSGDPYGAGQDITSQLLGKILRIDVDGTGSGDFDRYSIPSSNPFVGQTGDDQIWAYGLRNPWRISFDRGTGRLWIADVGQNRREEVNRAPSGDDGGRNYGWSTMEGSLCYEPSSGCNTSGKAIPTIEYAHGSGRCSITGGYVYRGETQRQLIGEYVFADYCTGEIWRSPANTTSGAKTLDLDVGGNITSFGEAENGEIWFVTQSGGLYRLLAPEFTDIASSTFIDDIHWLVYEGLTAGCSATRYCPTDSVTREQMAIFLDRALDLPSTGTDFFTDDDGRTGEAAINRLRAAGIAAGCTPTTFCPTNSVTREQMALFLDRALGLPSTGTDYFTDDQGRTGEAAINRLRASGITSGCTATTFCPTAQVTREQMAAFLRRAFEE
jgi:glucose/arabinose dehydrogenase